MLTSLELGICFLQLKYYIQISAESNSICNVIYSYTKIVFVYYVMKSAIIFEVGRLVVDWDCIKVSSPADAWI